MKVVLYMAMSLNGVIATENHSEDFLSHENWHTFVQLAEKTGCFIVGRETYDEVKKWPAYNFDNVNAKKLVISKNMNLKDYESYFFASSPRAALEKAKSLGYNKVLLTGGSTINSAFMKNKLINEVIINIEPYVLGRGIKIFAEDNFEQRLKLFKTKKLSSGIIQLHYKVIK